MWADHAVFCDEFKELLCQACLLQDMSHTGDYVILNNVAFEITTPSIGATGSKVHRTVMVKLADGKKVTRKNADRVDVAGVRPMLTDNGLVIEDLYLDRNHISAQVNDRGEMRLEAFPLLKSKPWKKRGEQDYLAVKEYELHIGGLAASIRPKLAEAAKLRVIAKKEARRREAEIQAAKERAFLDSVQVSRVDVGEQNDAWGMF